MLVGAWVGSTYEYNFSFLNFLSLFECMQTTRFWSLADFNRIYLCALELLMEQHFVNELWEISIFWLLATGSTFI